MKRSKENIVYTPQEVTLPAELKNAEYHIPALLTETIDGLNIKPNGIYVDVTFGGGGLLS